MAFLAEYVMTTKTQEIVPASGIESRILLIRGSKVMLDADLAELYQVSTKRLNEQVKRNRERFPEDFMFQLTPQETAALRSQFATSSGQHGGRRYRPYAFTEHGAVMLASVLNSPVAVQASIRVVRAFIHLREVLATHKELARKLTELERRITTHDERITTLFEAIRQLTRLPERPRRQIGFSAAAKAGAGN
ncbi:MAG TPA: ORF6N domain-containing protein [Terriglobia bacterium]|nr:ORF6N domain-containing protein [Terriglobia bacterium]